MNYHKWTEHVRSFSEALRHLPGEMEVTLEIAPPLGKGKHPTNRHVKDLVGASGWSMVVDANTKATH